MDEDSVIEAAVAGTGLADFGSDDHLEPLRVLLSSLEQDAQLTFVGRVAARSQVITLLANRLRMQDWWTRHPEILTQPVAGPVFVVGLPRSGTTLLQQLLACDEDNRSLLFWEATRPAPPPDRETYESDPRIAAAARAQRVLDYVAPEANRLHPVGAQLPTECVSLLAHSFASLELGAINRVPAHLEWCLQADLAPHYRYFRAQLQLLQWRCPGARWTLKSPAHLLALDALFEVFPDARVVWLHRDPATSVTSHCSLVSVLHAIGSDAVDRQGIGREWSHVWGEAVTRALQVRAVRRTAVHDVAYADLVGDPVGTVAALYAWMGVDLHPASAQAMRSFLVEQNHHHRGVHRYAPEDFGLDAQALRSGPFAAYTASFAN
ncbi:MAG: sulfotransferase family protein [Acidimicrobiia bacterium]